MDPNRRRRDVRLGATPEDLSFVTFPEFQIRWSARMTQTVAVLILDLLEWVARRDRSYEETMDAWRTSCPRLPVWEDATDRGLVSVEQATHGLVVRVTPVGLAFLKEHRKEWAG
jgi:hypothetical protein